MKINYSLKLRQEPHNRLVLSNLLIPAKYQWIKQTLKSKEFENFYFY